MRCDCCEIFGPKPELTIDEIVARGNELFTEIKKGVNKLPHDCKGNLLNVGDRVIVPFIVTSVSLTDDYCNLSLKSCATMPPEHKYTTDVGSINTKQVIRANKGDDTSYTVVRNGTEIRIG